MDRRQLMMGVLGAMVASPLGQALAETPQSLRLALAGGGGGVVWPRPVTRLPDELAEDVLGLSKAHGHRALLVWAGGELLFEDYGSGDNETTLMPGFSMAKTVLSMMYACAQDRGVIDGIDEPVSAYIDEWKHDARGELTARQLLQMRSGLKLFSLARGEPEALAMTSGTHATEAALATPLAHRPGHEFLYANVNSQIAGVYLARAIMQQTGLSYTQALQAWLLVPMGTGQIEIEMERPNGHMRYFAGMHATARDWMSIALAMVRPLDRGGAIGRRGLAQIAAPSDHRPYGLHVWRGEAWNPRRHYGDPAGMTVPVDAPYLAEDMLVLDGAGGQRAYVSAQREMVIVRMGHPSWAWEDSALPNSITAYLDSL